MGALYGGRIFIVSLVNFQPPLQSQCSAHTEIFCSYCQSGCRNVNNLNLWRRSRDVLKTSKPILQNSSEPVILSLQPFFFPFCMRVGCTPTKVQTSLITLNVIYVPLPLSSLSAPPSGSPSRPPFNKNANQGKPNYSF